MNSQNISSIDRNSSLYYTDRIFYLLQMRKSVCLVYRLYVPRSEIKAVGQFSHNFCKLLNFSFNLLQLVILNVCESNVTVREEYKK